MQTAIILGACVCPFLFIDKHTQIFQRLNLLIYLISLITLNYHRGHGTVVTKIEKNEYLIASVTGMVEKVNKLITVRPSTSRYSPEIGDIVVGRIVEVADKRWKLDINARQNAGLLISSVNLPGGQRRRTEADSLQMRTFLSEGDLVSAEVQKLMSDRSVSLHTRSLKYGKLGLGVLVCVPASLIKRSKIHFHTLDSLNIDVLIGHNGYIWICPTPTEEEKEFKRMQLESDSTDTSSLTPPEVEIDMDKRESIARLRNSVDLLGKARKLVYIDSILHVYNASVQMNLPCSKMFENRHVQALTANANADL